ncbi:retrotransposon protein, putative, ty1-copia subclass [Tanacetum coccineum]
MFSAAIMMPCAPYKLRVVHVGNYQTLITFRVIPFLMVAAAQNTNTMTIRSEGKLAHLEQPLIPPSYLVASQVARDAYNTLYNAQNEVACLMLGSMSHELQRTMEKYNAYDMLKELKTMFEEQIKSYLDTLERLGYAMPNELGVSFILNSLNKDYDQFVQNYNMHSMGNMIVELQAMLKLHEKGAKGKDKGKNKLAYAPKPKIPPPPKRENPAKDSVCHYYKEVGHWRRNCPSYQAYLKKRKNASMASTSGGLKRSKKLKHRALSLYMGNGMRAAVEAIRSFNLILPSVLIIVLDNCHFAPTVTSGAVSISCLVENGYIHTFTNYGIFTLKDNVFYFNAILHDGIYEIDMHNLYPNVSSTFNVSNKRVKYSLDSYYLWHCHLGHINKKRMDKLQRNWILQSTHDESLKKCKSCISGKMAHNPFPHKVERAKDLLGLIHTDVCNPYRTVSREGASYFITFIDDFNCYGYVYLMKHKHEVYETFKVFQNEVENQLGKKIKAIRSDRGGVYLSHEFFNHMKSYGIVSQLTSPYTPQHNGVSEMRNQTLLDMVRSMINLITLPKFFWGYALESAARILNMFPTKKVEMTPCEIWHWKAPKLSYLRVWGCEILVKRDAPDKLDPRSIKCIFVGYPKEIMGYYFYYPPKNKIFVAQNAEFFKNSLIVQEASGSHRPLKMSGSDEGLELFQEEDTQPSKNTSEEHNEAVPIVVEPQNVKVPIRRSARIPQVPDIYGFYVDSEEHELGDQKEPLNYKATLSYPEYDKWLEAMNTEIQSLKDNQV